MAQEEFRRRGLLKKNAVVDYEVWKWKTKLEQARATKRVTKTEVQAYAIQAYKDAGITFKASDGWYRRWRVRWTQPGVIKMKNSKGKEDFKNRNEGDKMIENLCETDKIVEPSKLREHQTDTTPKIINRHFKKGSVKTDDEVVDLEGNRKTGHKEDCSNVCNNSEVSSVSNLSANKFDQGYRNKIASNSSVSSEINENVDGMQLKCKKASFNVLREKTVSSLSETNLLESMTTSSSSTESNIINNVAETEPIELDMKTFTLIDRGSSSQSIDNHEIKGCDQDLSKKSDKHSEMLKDHSGSINANPMLSNFINSESITGELSSPSTSMGFGTFKIDSPLLDERDLEFGAHEFFCDFCEDFHPQQKTFHPYCCKQTENSSFLRCVFEKKDLNNIYNIPHSNTNEEQRTKKTVIENLEEKNLKNRSVLFTKGKRYLIQFKSKVVNYALNHNTIQAANLFKVNRNTVSEWLEERRRSSRPSAQKPKIKSLTLPDDKEFLSWLDSSKFNLTNELIKQKAGEWLRLENASVSKCEWLRMYSNRLNSTEDGSIKKRYITYPEAFKRTVVFHAQTHSNMAAARVFGVSRRRVMEWQEIFNDAKVKKLASASYVTDEAVDKQLFEWYSSQDPSPTSKQVRCKGLQLYSAAGYSSIQCGAHWYYRWRARHKLPPARNQLHKEVPLLSWVLTQLDNNQSVTHIELAQAYNSISNSKVSRGWNFRFCRKYYKLLQSIPEPSVPLPVPLERQVKSFLKTLHELVQTAGYKETEIIALDEVPLHFLPQDVTKKPLLIRRSGFQTCQASLVVSSLADGTLLPTMFVFKGVAPAGEADSCVVPVVNDSGLVSEDTMTQWVSSVCTSQLQGKHGLLITDCFDAHTSGGVQKVTADHKIHHAVIPGGCSFKLLPITRLCQLFKSMLEDMCQGSVTSQTSSLTPPSPDQLYLWSVRVHKHLAKYHRENIKIAFKDMQIHPCTTINA